MVCLGVESGVAGWKAQTSPLSNGGTPKGIIVNLQLSYLHCGQLANSNQYTVLGFEPTAFET